MAYLQLTSLSGEDFQITIDQEFDRFNEFETAVLEQLSTIGGTSTFGCELTFARHRAAPEQSGVGHPQRLQPVSKSCTPMLSMRTVSSLTKAARGWLSTQWRGEGL